MEGVTTTAALAQCVAVSCSVSHLTRLPLSSRRRNWSFGTRRSKEVPGVISLPKGASSTRQVSCCSLESCRSLRRKPAVPPAVVVISPQPSSNKEGELQKWEKVLGMAVLAGSSLLLEPNAARAAESLTDACTEIAGGNGSTLIVIACVVEAVALTGAAVGGIIARQRKNELERINAQLRQINVNLRRQSRVESYAPSLTYAPVGAGRMMEMPVRSDPTRDELMQRLKGGKRLLREQKPAQAFLEFEEALDIARQLKDTVEEKKAARGLGASLQRQGKYKEAIKYHNVVLSVSQRTGEHAGNTEAYGAIADCYTELGDLENAAKFYDQYIGRLESEDVD
ncbi:hypothetical protein BDL97_19G076600 [Sphagnum fallax]|nr:hypothetical protein BDL97_19G076600 [Sphagnum fallax]